jgi:hypothetical protein
MCAALEQARRGTDLLITTGGASVGERDLIKSALEEMGAEFEFRTGGDQARQAFRVWPLARTAGLRALRKFGSGFCVLSRIRPSLWGPTLGEHRRRSQNGHKTGATLQS